jgi:hypothetical protein
MEPRCSQRKGRLGRGGRGRLPAHLARRGHPSVPHSGDKCAYGCAYRFVSASFILLHFVATIVRGSCSTFRCLPACCSSLSRTFNPKVAGSIPARPIESEKTRASEAAERRAPPRQPKARLPTTNTKVTGPGGAPRQEKSGRDRMRRAGCPDTSAPGSTEGQQHGPGVWLPDQLRVR